MSLLRPVLAAGRRNVLAPQGTTVWQWTLRQSITLAAASRWDRASPHYENRAGAAAPWYAVLLLAAGGTSAYALLPPRVAHADASGNEALSDASDVLNGVVASGKGTQAVHMQPDATGKAALSAELSPPTTLGWREIAAVRAELNNMLDEREELAPALVGIAWLASSSYDTASGTGGSDSGTAAALAERKGGDPLDAARIALQQLGGRNPGMSAGDLVTLAGAVAVEHMGGPSIQWRAGRLGSGPESANVELKAAAAGKTSTMDRRITEFTRQVRSKWAPFTEREMVALIGGLAVCKGYPTTSSDQTRGEWAHAPTSFSNEYFRDLVGSHWTLVDNEGPDQFENGTGGSVMQMGDMVLLWDKGLRKYAEEFAKDEDAFFEAFSEAFQKMEELGVASFCDSKTAKQPWYKFW
jgi:cytochrome c peroxidase